MGIQVVTQDSLDDFLDQSSVICLVFTATWCQPCQVFHQVIEKAAEKYQSRVEFGLVDIEQQPQLKEDFQVMSVPWVMILRNSVAVYADSGALTAGQLDELIFGAEKLDISAMDNEG